MQSIGLLGFIVWSQMALQRIKILIIINGRELLVKREKYVKYLSPNLAKCWNSYNLFSSFINKWAIKISTYLYSTFESMISQLIFSYSENLNKYSLELISSHSEKKDTQSAGLYTKVLVNKPSETQRKDSQLLDTTWIYWFVGFIEGDGAIQYYDKTGPLLVLTQKEGKIQYNIKEKQNIGRITYNKKNDYYRWIVNKKTDIQLILEILNGRLVLQKRANQLKKWINWLRYNDPINYSQLLLQPQVSPSIYNAWLSGFTDAEGCFNVNIVKRSKTCTGYRVQQRYILDQKSSKSELTSISTIIFNNVGKVSIRKSISKDMYRYSVTSFKSQTLIIDYFTKYPQKTKKQIDYNKWSYIHTMVQNKEHLSELGLIKIRNLKKEINLGNSQNRGIGHSLKK